MIDSETFNRHANDPAAFRADILIDVDGTVRRFGDVMDPWQHEDFAALDAALMRCAGQSEEPTRMRAYLERPRGHSKTTDLAITAIWALAFASRPIRGYAFAADRDQSRLLRDSMQTITRLNAWIGDILSVEAHRVVNKAAGHPGETGTLTIEASDVGSSFGILPDLIIADELTHWQGDGSLWHSLISSAAKRSGCLLVTISNAGMIDSWQWDVREAARTSNDWYFASLNGPVASWIDEARLQEQRKMLPAVAYQRLWENCWSNSGGDALPPSEICAAFFDDLQPMTGREPGWLYAGGIDLGLTRDCSAVVVLAVPAGGRSGRIRLADHRLWRPMPGRKINLMEVEEYVLELDRRFGLEQVAFDPWQAELLGQRLEAQSGHQSRNQRRRFGQPWMREIAPTSANLREIASLTIECFQDHRMMLYPCEPLRRDLTKLRCEERQAGSYRLVSPRDGEGHGDCFSAFSLALLVAHELAGEKRTVVGAIDLNRRDQRPAWMEEFEEQAALCREEMQFLHEQGAGYNGYDELRSMMGRLGRF